MADSSTAEAKEALLKAIAAKAPGATAAQLEHLAVAYAMTVGGASGCLPGFVPPSS